MVHVERVTPHDQVAEQSLLGAILVDPDLFGLVSLSPMQFFRPAHRYVWEAFGRLHAAGTPIDIVTLRDDLLRAGRLDAVGGVAYIAGLDVGVPRAVNVESYATIIRDKALMRALIAVCKETEEAAYGHGDAGEILDQATARILAVGEASLHRDEFVLAPEWMQEMRLALDTALRDPRIVTGVPSGLASLDNLTRGFQPGDLILLAARPSVGKTALALQMALEASRHVFTAFVSLEMPRQSMGWRTVSLESRVDAFRLMTGKASSAEQGRASDALARMGSRGIAIDDMSGQSAGDLCAKLRRLAAKHGTGAIFVDYVQLMSGDRRENRTQEVSDITRRLKALAKDLRLPLIALSQLTRDNERENRPPRLSDLREGGSLEQDADVVLFLHRPRAEKGRYLHGEVVELLLEKQRMGQARVVLPLHWSGPTMMFADQDTTHGDDAPF